MIKRIIDSELFVHENGKIYSAHRTEAAEPKKYTIAVVIDTVMAIPPTTGVTYRLYYLSKELVARGHRIIWILGNRNFKTPESLEELRGSGVKIHLLPPDDFYDAEHVSAILMKENVDIVQYEITQTFITLGLEIRERTGIPTLLELHDVEATLRDTLDRKEESPSMKFLQYIAGEYADAIISMTPVDHATLTEEIGVQKTKMTLVPNGVNATPDAQSKVRSDDTLLFVGNLYYPPNQKGFIHIADELLPELRKTRKVVLKSVGMIPDELRKRYGGREDIMILGEIKDAAVFAKEVGSSTIGLCTVFAGSGMKIKILDYCRFGLPVIATTIGASGYEGVDSIIVKDTKEETLAAIHRLLDDKEGARVIGQRNKEKILGLYGWPAIAEKFETACALATDFNMERFKALNIRPFWLEEDRHAPEVLNSHMVIDNDVIHPYEQ